jgi:3-hydroxyisobutyrate dehydrogenase
MHATVLGTGIMGAAMARSLARDGHDVAVWNRTAARARAAEAERITAYPTVGEAVGEAEVVLTVVYDADSVLGLTAEIAESLGADAVWAQVSTVGPEGIRRIADAAAPVSDRLLDAPVLGTRQPAEDGNLVVLVSGPAPARERAQAAFDAIGSRTMAVGDEVGPASALKLVCNSWVASVNTGVAQAVGFAEALDLDPQLFLEAIRGGPTDSGYAQLKGSMMVEQRWDVPSFALDSVVKDVGLMVDTARDSGYPDELLATLLALYDRASERGYGDADMAAIRTAFDR